MSRVLFAICDGCVTNGAALTTVKLLQPCLIEMICISHAANVKKNVRNTKPTCHILLMAVRELELYFRTLSNESVKKPSAVRWFVWLEMARPTLILVQLRQLLDTRTNSTLKPDENVPIVKKISISTHHGCNDCSR